MSTPFNPHTGLVTIIAHITGPTLDRSLRLAVDTGASRTVISALMLRTAGYDPDASPDRAQMTTASSVESVARLLLLRISALDQERTAFPVYCHDLPLTSTIDGVLGLDFFRGQTLTIDFRAGLITLA